MSWVLTSERKPTADDADENGLVWVTWHQDGSVHTAHYEKINNGTLVDFRDGKVWHPKPKATPPEPYKPPVPERLEGWVVICKGYWHSKLDSVQDAIDTANDVDGRVVHFREVRDGDPSPEDVADVIRRLKELSVEIFGGGWNVHKDELECCIRRLGGKP